MITLKTFDNTFWPNMKDILIEYQTAGTLNKTYDVTYYMNINFNNI